MPDNELTRFYLKRLAYQASGSSEPPPDLRPKSLAEFNSMMGHVNDAMAQVNNSDLIIAPHGLFACSGFPPGRYVFIGQDVTNSTAPAFSAYVDASNIRKRVIITVPPMQQLDH
jgi:hypothetical protein